MNNTNHEFSTLKDIEESLSAVYALYDKDAIRSITMLTVCEALKAFKKEIPAYTKTNSAGKLICPVCGYHVSSADRYCAGCGQYLTERKNKKEASK